MTKQCLPKIYRVQAKKREESVRKVRKETDRTDPNRVMDKIVFISAILGGLTSPQSLKITGRVEYLHHPIHGTHYKNGVTQEITKRV